MGLRVKVEVQPGETVHFPQRCVSCGQPAAGALRLRKRRERTTRELQAPLCADCRHELQRLSGDEERWLRMSWFFGALAFFLALLIFLFLLPGWLAFLPRLVLALLIAGGAGTLVMFYFRRRSAQYARPEKRAVRNAVRLHDFSWRTTTLEFADDHVAQQFIELNRDKIMET